VRRPTARAGLIAWIALVLAAGVVHADEKAPERRTISVVGRGEVKSVPDRLSISFAVETTAPRAAEAAGENAKTTAAVVAAVKSLLGADDTVTTARYSIEPRWETPRAGEPREPRIAGYVAHNEVEVESGRIDRAGALIDAATGAGANRVGGLQLSLSKRAELQRAAIEQAGADARGQAESVAKGLGVRLKALVSASTSPAPVPVVRRFEATGFAAEARAAPTPIEPGELTVSVTLQVTYEIE
jgi:hypothetical protein